MRPLALSLALPLALATACASLGGRSAGPAERWGFTAPWDPASERSVVAHAASLDAVVYGWIALDTADGSPRDVFRDTLSARAPVGTRRMALVTSYLGTRFHPETIRRLAASDALLARAAGAVAARAERAYRGGIVLDFEGHGAADVAAVTRVARAFTDSAHAHGVAPVAVAIPAGDTIAAPGAPFAAAADLVLVMLYDQHWDGSNPGAIAAPDWARRALAHRVAEIGAARVVVVLPLYGYQWPAAAPPTLPPSVPATVLAPSAPGVPNPGAPPALAIGHRQALDSARAAGAPLVRDPATATLTASTPRWTIWVADADLLRALLDVVSSSGVRRVGLWRLGLEDPAVWSILAAPR